MLDDLPADACIILISEAVSGYARSERPPAEPDPTRHLERGLRFVTERFAPANIEDFLATVEVDRCAIALQQILDIAGHPELYDHPFVDFGFGCLVGLQTLGFIDNPTTFSQGVDALIAIVVDDELDRLLADAARPPGREAPNPLPSDLAGWLEECAWLRVQLPGPREYRLADGRSQRLKQRERLFALVAERRHLRLDRTALRQAGRVAAPPSELDPDQASDLDLLGAWLNAHLALDLMASADLFPLLSRCVDHLNEAEADDALPASGETWEFEVELEEVEPRVWRRIAVDPAWSMANLGDLLLEAMDWEDQHCWSIDDGAAIYADSLDFPRAPRGWRLTDADEVAIAEVLHPSADQRRWTLRYDLERDGWHHRLRCVARRPSRPDEALPGCLDGGGACPPERCGGPLGYHAVLQILADPAHPKRSQLATWLDDPAHFDPEAFDREAADAAMRAVFSVFSAGREAPL